MGSRRSSTLTATIPYTNPPGWQEEPGAENAISQSGNTGLGTMVIVQCEKALSNVTDVLAGVSARTKANAGWARPEQACT